MDFRGMDSVCFESRSNWHDLRLDLPDVSMQMLPDRLPSLSEYVPDDFPSPQLKEDLEGNLIVQLDKVFPRTSAQDVLPRSCFDVLNSQAMTTVAAHSHISTSLATVGDFQSAWSPLDCLPAASGAHSSVCQSTNVCQNLTQDRNSPFAPSLAKTAVTFRELSSGHHVSTQNSSFPSTVFPMQANFRVSSIDSHPVSNCLRSSEKSLLSSSAANYSAEGSLPVAWSGLQQQQHPGSFVNTADRKLSSLEVVAAPELSKECSGGFPIQDCSVTWSTGGPISSGIGRADKPKFSASSARKRTSEWTTNLEDVEAKKLELKRAKNREAAQRCQQRKHERIARLEGKVGKLKEQNVALAQTVTGLREQITWLQRQIVTHTNNGCQLPMSRFLA